MKRKDLSGYIFKGKDVTNYIVTAGYEDGEVAFEEVDNPQSTLHFCCDATVTDGKLKGSYQVSYTVSKEELFKTIDNFYENRNTDEIAKALKSKYYKIPIVFLKLVGEAYLKERK